MAEDKYTSPDIPGVDTERGIAMTGGTLAGYKQVLDIFRRDAEERLRMCRFFLFGDGNMSEKFPEKHLPSLITQVQALKSASATIGAMGLSEKAARLEIAGKNRELVLIQSSLFDFVEQLSELTQNIRTALEQGRNEELGMMNEKSEAQTIPNSSLLITNYLNELMTALLSKNVLEIDRILDNLYKESLNSKLIEMLEKISDQVLMTEFDSAIKTIKDFFNTVK